MANLQVKLLIRKCFSLRRFKHVPHSRKFYLNDLLALIIMQTVKSWQK